MNKRVLLIVGIVALTLTLLSVTLVLAQGGGITPANEESRREAEAAAAAVAGSTSAAQSRAASGPAVAAPTDAPLFIGISEVTVPAYAINPVTADETPLFDGYQIWGSAYDEDHNRVLFSSGTQLFEWPLGKAPKLLGTVTSAANGVGMAFVGLAYYDGVLYGTTNVGAEPNPEAVYTIDPDTRQAKLHIAYTQPLTTIDNGGLAADPDTGALYATNDSTVALVRIEANGDLTKIVAYPTGQTDIDGLAIGDGRAYLVTDQPGDIYMYDFAAEEYAEPIPNPWATSELFAGATWIDVPPPTIALSKTVGTNPDACATESAINVGRGEDVTYCYMVKNTGFVTLTLHTLDDSALGSILEDFPYTLAPGTAAFITRTVVIEGTTTNTAVWKAYNLGSTEVATATAEATVTVIPPSIVLTKTVGTDPDDCATESEIIVEKGTSVTYCYQVENTGLTALAFHTLEDSALGNVLKDFAYGLTPGSSVFITATATITQDTTNTATWTAFTTEPMEVVTATAQATVRIAGPHIQVDAASLTVSLEPDEQTTRPLTISNVGTETVAWALSFAPEDCAAPGALPWASFAPSVGTTGPGGSSAVTVTFDATGAIPGKMLTGVLCVTSSDEERPVLSVPLSLMVGGSRIYLPAIAGSSQN